MELDIWLEDQFIARSRGRDRGRKLTIVYDERVVADLGNEVPLLSCSLPTPGPSTASNARSFLEGLLPEGRALETMAANMRNVRLQDGAPATSADAVALLAQYGRDCAGAVVIVPSGTDYQPSQGDYRQLNQEDLAEILRDLPEHPLGANPDREIRMSLAGAQPKFLLARFDNKWFEPLRGAASTHILKPTTRWPYSAENEALVMHFARATGLTAWSTWVERISETSVLAVERYDRRVEGKRVVRTHQEDLCQALGIRPLNKYQIGRPSALMARLLRRFADVPAKEVANLFAQVAFRTLVGDEDGHGKNYSLLLNNGQVELAPLYDSICTLAYPELSGSMAAPIGNQSSLAEVDRQALIEEAIAMGVLQSDANSILEGLTTDIRASISSLDASFTSGWPSELVIDVITSRLDRLESGHPLGGHLTGSPAGRPRRATDMTTQTAYPEGFTDL
jgi:serine/threonine-protein kinase HipA